MFRLDLNICQVVLRLTRENMLAGDEKLAGRIKLAKIYLSVKNRSDQILD